MMTAALFSVCDSLVLPGSPFLLSAVMGAGAEERPGREAERGHRRLLAPGAVGPTPRHVEGLSPAVSIFMVPLAGCVLQVRRYCEKSKISRKVPTLCSQRGCPMCPSLLPCGSAGLSYVHWGQIVEWAERPVHLPSTAAALIPSQLLGHREVQASPGALHGATQTVRLQVFLQSLQPEATVGEWGQAAWVAAFLT